MENEKILMSLDLGSQNIKAMIGAIDHSGALEIKGMGVVTCSMGNCGISEGIIKNIEMTVRNISQVVNDAQSQYGENINDLIVGFSGRHIESRNEEGSVVVSGREHEIDQEDVERVKDQAKTKVEPLPESKTVVKQIPRWYSIDGEDRIKEPRGMSGIKLGVDMHIILSNTQQIRNIEKCVMKADLGLKDTVPNLLASSMAVMDKDESELGCMVLDMGAGTTDIAVFIDDALHYSDVLEIGGNIVTRDLATVLKTPKNKAEQLKIRYGTTYIDESVDPDELIEVPAVGGRPPGRIKRENIEEIIRPRLEEIGDLIFDRVRRNNINITRDLPAGIILTGGMARLHGFDRLLEQMFDVQVKIGVPGATGTITGLDVSQPQFAAPVGLLLYGKNHLDEYEERFMGDFPALYRKITGYLKRLFSNR